MNNNIEIGLTKEEVKEKQLKYGKNILPKEKKNSLLKIFLLEFKNPIILLMIVAIIFSVLIKEYLDAYAIVIIILIDAIIGTVQEYKANKTTEALKDIIKVKVKVLRDGIEQEIDSEDLVVGDIVLLESGNKISADLILLLSKNLTIDESILTGESINILKTSTTDNKLYAGTSVITGRGKARVISIGINTEIGKIADKVIETKVTDSPLTIRMNKFTKQVSIFIIILSIILTITLLLKKISLSVVFLSVIALSVSAMPEGLPLAITLALTIGSVRMSKKKVIVKKLNSVESLGSCTVIASDKTGTLTVNEQTAKKVILPDNSLFDIEGTGYNNIGNIIPKEDSNLEDLKYLSKLGYINNEATLIKENNIYIHTGDSIDIAFKALGEKVQIDVSKINIIDKIAYESENKYSAVFYKENDVTYCTIKGSIEKVFEFCTTMKYKDNIIEIDKESIIKQNEYLASIGYRVIAIAQSTYDNDKYDEKSINDLTFIGLVGFIDPIRVETIDSIKSCHKSGIKVIMITGDHPLTAYSIGKDLGLINKYDEVATKEELEFYYKKGLEELDNYIKTRKIFSRVDPLQKLLIVESLKRQNEFVAVTGDGVNDAPAIKAANIGIAMGSGTDVAKDTSSMIILDNNFLSIVEGIKEGRNAYSNIRKVIYMLISCGISEVLFFLLSVILDLPIPLLAIQLLWLNLVTDGMQDIALSFEKQEKGIMSEKPRNPEEKLFDKTLIEEVLLSGITIGLTVFFVWMFLINNLHMNVSNARGYVMALMVFIQNIHMLNCRSEKKSAFKISLFKNPFVIITIISSIALQIIVMEVPIFSKLLETTTIPFNHMLLLILVGLPILLVMELYKKIRFNNKRKEVI